MSMTSHERLMAALRGHETDRIPWSPFLAYWWEDQPQAVQDRGQIWFLKEIGADALLRGFKTPFANSDACGIEKYPSFRLPFDGCEVRRTAHADRLHVEFETPVGNLTLLARTSSVANSQFVTEHPIKRREDYKILSYLIEHMRIEPDYGPIAAEIAEVGDDGLSVPLISPFQKTPFQALVEHFVGTERLIYDLQDFPEEVEALLAVMSERALEAVRIAATSPAEAFITWEDSSTTNVSPALFARYIAPELDRWGEVVHDAGKLLIHHACGHVRKLLPIMVREKVDAIESVSPPPTGNIEIWDAQAALGADMSLIGGIEPVHFLTLEMDELRAYIEELLDRINPHRYILANSDSCPPGVTVEKFRLVTKMVRERAG